MTRYNKILLIINIFLVIVVLIILSTMSVEYLDESTVCVPNGKCAVEIAKNICSANYPDINFDEYTWKYRYIDESYNGDDWQADTWIVWCTPFSENVLDGELTEIHIRRKNAEVVQFNYGRLNDILE